MVSTFLHRTAQADENTVSNAEKSTVFGFTLIVENARKKAGASFKVVVQSVSENGSVVEDYMGEGFSLGGGDPAPDGTMPIFVQRGQWSNGRVEFDTVLYSAGGPIRLFASGGGIKSESGEIWISPGDPDELVITAGNNLFGPPGEDVVKVSGAAPEVVVCDRWMNPVDGVTVEFGNATNGGSFDARKDIDGDQSVKVTKDGGRAACDVWVLGRKYGLNTLDAWIRDETVPAVTFEARSYYITTKNLGLIFNVGVGGGDFIRVGAYQGGVGVKYFFHQRIAYRGLFDYEYVNNSRSTSLTLGNTVEYHFLNGRISPYLGGLFDIGYVKARGEVDPDNWTESLAVPVTMGPLIGFEAVAFDFLSFFMEYRLVLEITGRRTRTSAGGVVTETKGSDFTVKTGFGNDAKIGAVLYLNRVATGWRRPSNRSRPVNVGAGDSPSRSDKN